jgi:alpha-ketoglutaric semialdehyde dehydrogenase
MNLQGTSLIAGTFSQADTAPFQVASPLDQSPLEPSFYPASEQSIAAAAEAAATAAAAFAATSPIQRAGLLEKIGDELLNLGDELLECARRETGLPTERLAGERGRTIGQLRQFAALLREGSWCDARIDTAQPDRQPLPRPDIRRVLAPLGPVAVFGASNFPLAFSVAGGDTASALAAGCPVVVKAHPAHPGTSELAACAVQRAIATCGLSAGIFSMIQGNSPEHGLALVRHPAIKAVGFTGSEKAGRALFDAACARPSPIPVFAEMGSLNPVFLLAGALQNGGNRIAEGLKNSVTMGVGQFCTKPGIVFGVVSEAWTAFKAAFASSIEATTPATMLHGGIWSAYRSGLEQITQSGKAQLLAEALAAPDPSRTQGRATAFVTSASSYLSTPQLRSEVFGPFTLLVEAATGAELLHLASQLEGQLTATIHAASEDLDQASQLATILQTKAGRLLLNGFPTGVEVCPSMQQGGPYPASTDTRFTSVGTAAILRWARPVCFQSFPQDLLPEELRDSNPRGILRTVNGTLTRDPV